MCLAIYAPAGSDIPEKNLKNGFDNNSDGAGMAWATDGQLHVRKGMFKFEEVIVNKKLNEAQLAELSLIIDTKGKYQGDEGNQDIKNL